MKRKGTWAPSRGLGGIPAESKPMIDMTKLGASKTMENIGDVIMGMFLGVVPFAAANPNCVHGSGIPERSEIGLAAGLGVTGLYWLITGQNYVGISGAVSTLAAYGICKYVNQKAVVKPQVMAP